MRTETVFSGDTSAKATVCTNCGKPVGSERFCANCGTPTGQAKCTQCGNDVAPVLGNAGESRLRATQRGPSAGLPGGTSRQNRAPAGRRCRSLRTMS
jgi:hypothetical protein